MARRPWIGGPGSRGVALLLTIWALALLAVLALGLTANVRTGAGIERDQVALAQARALADAGFWQGLAEMLDPNAAAALPCDGTPYAMTIDGQTTIVSIQDEAGKVDLNAASADQLERLFRAAGMDQQTAASLARNIDRYRARAAAEGRRPQDADFHGSAPARAYAPAFLSPQELRLVDGMTPGAYARILPLVTVYNGDWRINPLAASRTVLLSLAGMDAPTVERFLNSRTQSHDRISARIAAPPMLASQAEWRPPRIVTVRSKVNLGSDVVAGREGVVDIAPGGDQLFRILTWTSG